MVIDGISQDVALLLSTYLSTRDLGSLFVTSKSCRTLFSHDRIWKAKLRQECPSLLLLRNQCRRKSADLFAAASRRARARKSHRPEDFTMLVELHYRDGNMKNQVYFTRMLPDVHGRRLETPSLKGFVWPSTFVLRFNARPNIEFDQDSRACVRRVTRSADPRIRVGCGLINAALRYAGGFGGHATYLNADPLADMTFPADLEFQTHGIYSGDNARLKVMLVRTEDCRIARLIDTRLVGCWDCDSPFASRPYSLVIQEEVSTNGPKQYPSYATAGLTFVKREDGTVVCNFQLGYSEVRVYDTHALDGHLLSVLRPEFLNQLEFL